ncbi:TAXI family TRAP transporter solute-binding subunit [Salinarimonas soli]|nr:TAXI family TRAP transporter solute-binding subunit [Salinarimonas soli]
MRHVLVVALTALATWSGFGVAQAQTSARPAKPAQAATQSADKMNAGVVSVISGGVNGTYVRIAAEMANVLDNGENLRVLPIIGRGSAQNIRDLLFLKGVDIGIVQMDARESLGAEAGEGKRQLEYIARLYNEEIHVIARRDIGDIRQLGGRKVNIDVAGSGTNLTSRIVFERLGVKPAFETVDQGAAFEKLASGEIDAAVFVSGRPVRAVAEFKSDGRFKLLSIPFEESLSELYLPARLADKDYPGLIERGGAVDTLAVGSILAVYGWPEGTERNKRVQRFVEAFFSRFDEFLKPGRHPKWQEVNLAATVPGWKRFKGAQDWIDRSTSAAAKKPDPAFEAFLESRDVKASPTERQKLFEEFVAWQNSRAGARATR